MVVATDDAVWFGGPPSSAARDFFELCDHARDAFEAAARALGHPGGAQSDGLRRRVDDAQARLRAARTGGWAAYERHLRQLGEASARVGIPGPVWPEVARAFSDVIVARAVAAHAADPAQLTAVLHVQGAYVARVLALVAGGYDVARRRRDRVVTERQRRVLDGSIDAVIEIDEDDRVLEINRAAEHIFGIARHTAIGQPIAALIVPERLRDRHRAGLARLLADGEPHMLGRRVELTALRRDGAEIPIELSLVATVRDGGGRGFVGFLRDLSEQRRVADSLAHGAARLQILSSAAHEFAASSGDIEPLLALVARRLADILGEACAVRLISGDGSWLEPSTSFYHQNPAHRELARQVLGSQRQRLGDGLAGRVAETGAAVRIPEVDPAQLLATTAAPFRAMLAQIGVASAMAIPLRSRGRTIGAISLFRSTPGSPYTLDDQHLAQDLADRAGLAIDNAVLVDTLEQRVTERTAALEAANRELEAFTYSVSHDLRTPLRAIDGFSRVLLADHEAKLDDRGVHYLHRICAGTQRMATLIDDLLNLARITRTRLKLGDVDVSALASEVAAELRKRDPERAIAIHIAPGLTARADARMLRIVLDHLLGNAWKFTAQHGGAQIWVGADGDTFHVRDTGAGFDMAYAEKLFTPFQRLHAAREYEGTGIGLATVHRIITHHGGTIRAEAEIGKGATFFFTVGARHGRTP
jgi:PAS domain S-box-containing protein